MKSILIKQMVATIYKEPRFTSETVDEGLYGMQLYILNQVSPDWFYIRTHYNYEGYVHKDIFCTQDFEWKPNLYVTSPFADVLVDPRIQSPCLVTIPKGGMIEYALSGIVLESWIQVRLVTGEVGWILKGHVQNTPKAPIIENEFRKNVIQTALTYMNIQYRWGGKSPLGIDCSGLTSMVYMINGVIIFRDADVEEGFPVRKIDLHEMKEGDLLYSPGHIMLYIGHNKYIHSSLGGEGVKINSLLPTDSDYRKDIAENLLFAGTIF